MRWRRQAGAAWRSVGRRKQHEESARNALQERDSIGCLSRLKSDDSVRRIPASWPAPRPPPALAGFAVAPLRAGGAGLAAARRLVGLHDRRWPSNTVVSQGRSFSIRAAQIFAAAAASLERAGDQPQLHAEPVVAFLDHDDRPQRRQRRVRPRFQQPAPQRAQAADRIGAADIDAEFGALDRELGQRSPPRSASLVGRPTPRLPASALTVTGRSAGGLGGSISFPAAGIGRRHHRFRRPSAAWPGVQPLRDRLRLRGRRRRRVRTGERRRRAAERRLRPARAAAVVGFGRRRLGGCRRLVGAARPRTSRRAGPARRAAAAVLDGRSASAWSRLRRRRRRRLCRAIGAGHRIQALFQHGDAGIQPVAIAVERLDGGCQPPGLALAFLGDRLDLLRLPRQIGRRDLVAPRIRSTTGWRARPGRRRRPRQRPTIRAATARGGRTRPPRPKIRTARRRYFRSRSCQPDGR